MLPNIEKSGEQDEERSEECLVNTGSNIEPDSSIKDKRGDNSDGNRTIILNVSKRKLTPLTLSQTSPGFYVSALQVFLRTICEKEKLLVFFFPLCFLSVWRTSRHFHQM